MRKKLSSVLIGILLIFAGVFATACGDKYKKFEFNITYAFSEDSDTWYDANNGINLNYSVDGNEYAFDINGVEERVNKYDFNLYIKVEINGVKSKHLDSVTISEDSDNISFTSATVKPGKVVAMGIVGVVNSKISFYENQSGKSTQINVVIDGKLTDIETNLDIVPAVTVGGAINLNACDNLILYNEASGITTNQTGVTYEFVQFGSISGGVFLPCTEVDNSKYKKYVVFNNSELRINKSYAGTNFELNGSNNVIKLVATSVYDETLTTDVYVYIVEGDLVNPTLKYVNGGMADVDVNYDALTYKGLDLYMNTDESVTSFEYDKSTIRFEAPESLYKATNAIKTIDGKTLQFKVCVYVGNNLVPYDFSMDAQIQRDLLITANSLDNSYTIKMVSRSSETSVDVKFAYELVCQAAGNVVSVVTFTQNSPKLETVVPVRKHALTSSIVLNGQSYENGDTLEGIVYSTSNADYKGYELNVNLDPIDPIAASKQMFKISGISELNVRDINGTKITDGQDLLPDKDLFIRFGNSTSEQQVVTFSTRKTPSYFNGEDVAMSENIEVKLTLKKRVTADNLEFVDGTTHAPVREINVAANKTSNIYVKAYYSGTLDASTIQLVSPKYKFNSDGDLSLNLIDAEFESLGTETIGGVEKNYSIYKISLPATNSLESSKINIYAGELNKGASAEVKLNPVNVITNANNLKIVAQDNYNANDLTNNKFAVVKNKELDFNVYELVGGEKVGNTINSIKFESVSITGSYESYFGNEEVLRVNATLNSNAFRVQGWKTGTRIVNLVVGFYEINSYGVVKAGTKTIEKVQFAVYNPISDIYTNLDKDAIVYVNKLFPDAAQATITYNSVASSNDGTPTHNVYFMNGADLETISNVTDVDISIDKNLESYSDVKIEYLQGGSYTNLSKYTDLKRDAGISGNLKIRLADSFTNYDSVQFRFSAKRFGQSTSIAASVTIKFVGVDKAVGINITKGDIYTYSSTNVELQLSFMDSANDEVSASFGAEPKYNSNLLLNSKRFEDITYSLYKYTLLNGEIVYEADNTTPKLTQVLNFENSLGISIDNGLVTVTANKTKSNIGGLYKLVIATKDSYDDEKEEYKTTYSLNVRVSDGASVDSAFIVLNKEQFLKINNKLDAYYVLGNNIELGILERPLGYTVSGGSIIVAPFSGNLSGKLNTVTASGATSVSNYSISVTIKNNIQTSGAPSYYLYGLFSKLTGTINDLNIHIGYSEDLTTPNAYAAYIGGVVAENEGIIRNVKVYATGKVKLAQSANFGAIAGVNSGSIQNCKVDSFNELKIESLINNTAAALVDRTLCIGLLAGYNSGVITGGYLGKSSLSSIDFDAVANLDVLFNEISNANVICYVGGAVGYSTTEVSNLLVGGEINIPELGATVAATAVSGGVAGVVGYTTANIVQVAALGLDITSKVGNSLPVAGIAGSAAEISNARFISASVKHSFGTNVGKLEGHTIYGISGSGIVTYSTIESFITTLNDEIFYTLDGKYVYGMTAGGELHNSFVNANLKAENVLALTAPSAITEENTYFIGRVNFTGGYDKHSSYYFVHDGEDLKESNKLTALNDYITTSTGYVSTGKTTQEILKENRVLINASYSEINSKFNTGYYVAVYSYDSFAGGYSKIENVDGLNVGGNYWVVLNGGPAIPEFYVQNASGGYAKFDDISMFVDNYKNVAFTAEEIKSLSSTNWESSVMDGLTAATSGSAGFKLNSNVNNILLTDYNDVSFYLPYLVDNNNNLLLIEQPTSLKASINRTYQIENEQNIYIEDIELKEDGKYQIEESVMVDFFAGIDSNNSEVNTHWLVDTRCENRLNGLACSDDCHNGLLKLEMMPVTSGLMFEIIGNGSTFAKIEGNSKITFTGASNSQPIIVKVYSVFNSEVEVYVAFYSQQTFSKLTLEGADIMSGTGATDYVLNVYQGKASDLLTLSADNIIKGEEHESLFDRGSVEGYIKVEGEYDNSYLNVSIATLSAISINVNSGIEISNGQSKYVTLKVYLTEAYFGTGVKTDDLFIGEITINVLMYNVADGLTIIGADSFEVDTASTLNIQAELETGFINSADANKLMQHECVPSNGNIEVKTDTSRDSIYLTLSSASSEIERILTLTRNIYVVDLFDFEVFSRLTTSGYRYNIAIALKDLFDYRYITDNINLELKIWAKSNPNIQNSVDVVIKPTTANTIRLVNYAVEKINVVSSTKSELTRGNVETSIIAPGGRGNIMVAYIEKEYSNIDSISIESSDLYVPSYGKDVNLIFTQLVYNEKNGKFETLFNSNLSAQEGNKLELQKVTSINNSGKEIYSGLIYIHVQLIKFSGLEARITASLNVTSNGTKLATVSKDLLTTFLPGAYMEYSGAKLGDNKYLIQEDSYANSAKIRLYGYQFNTNPIMNIDWEIQDGDSTYFYDIDSVYNRILDSSNDEDIRDAFNNGTLYFKKTDGTYHKAKIQDDITNTTGKTYYSITSKKSIVKVGKVTTYAISNYVSTYFIDDYENVEYNSVDGSYTLEVKFNIAENIPTNFSLQAELSLISNEGQVESATSEAIMFCPTKYIVTDISIANSAGNMKMLAINRTDKIEFIFNTTNSNYDYSSEIYEIFAKNENGIGVDNLAKRFVYYNPTETTFAETCSEFAIAVRNNYLNITGLSKFEKEVTLSVYVSYAYVNGKYQIKFGEKKDGTYSQKLEYKFTLKIYPGAGEENATPIYYNYEMFDDEGNCLLAENAHYILMNDITLDVVKPIDYAIGSLDGNNFIIKIKNFAISDNNSRYGLFATLGEYEDEEGYAHKSILKNVVVDYSEFNTENNGRIEFTNNNITNVTFGGLAAENNGGLIYNCDVISKSGNKTITIAVDENATLTFGGLVGTNSGKITNSRVGRSSMTRIDAKSDNSETVNFGKLTFVLGGETNSGFDVIAGGFVGVNNGDVASSYFANTNLINYSNSETSNLTAGFVGRNNDGASIQFSYVKGLESSITSENPYASGAKIEGKSNSIIAGFVYANGGTIKDCYSNIELYTKSTYMAGFVYTNTALSSTGTISECYSACLMTTENLGIKLDAEQPFVGKDKQGNYLDSGIIENVYYLIEDSNYETGSSCAQALNILNFKEKSNLYGFVFIESDAKAERDQGVWSFTDLKGNALLLPELMNANTISHSAKYLISGNGTTEKFTYTNADSYGEGSKNNPYIIRNINEFNDIFTGGRTDMSEQAAKSGYMRFIDDIDFSEDSTAIKTRVKYTLGDSNSSNITSVEGNGMSISGIYFDVTEPGIDEIGLFAKIENAYVKNLTLNFKEPTGGQYSTTLVKYSGGLAGKITNSAIINIELNGGGVSLTGQNFVGGLAGLIEGNSLLYGIRSNLSAEATSKETGLYYSKTDYEALGHTAESYNSNISNLSYAGGLAGVLDLTKRENIEYNVSYIDIYGSEMYTRTNQAGVQLANISAQYAGGLAGFASRYTNSLKLKYHTGSSEIISGNVAAGGLFAVSLGKITASQVSATEDVQHGYDTEFGNYVINISDKTLNKDNVGNLSLIQSNNYAGGLIGVGVNASINASYSKASIGSGKIVGGLIGASVASDVTYSYAVPYVNLTNNTEFVGGLFGQAFMVKKGVNLTQNSTIKDYETLTNLYLRRENSKASVYTDIQYTFSTIIMDKQTVIDFDMDAEKEIKMNYISPSFSGNVNSDNIRSGGTATYTEIYVGTIDYSYIKPGEADITSSPVGSIAEKAKDRELAVLYNLSHIQNETIFNEIFSSWSIIPYWTIKNTDYFPLLTNKGIDNYIEIYNKTDLEMIASNPNGKYMIMNNIDCDTKTANWVFNCKFTGVLTGAVSANSNARKKITVSLIPNETGNSAGLFRETSGATITNLEFHWYDSGNGAIDTTGVSTLTNVAGLSCSDLPDDNNECSTFANVLVSSSDYLIKKENVTINNFAGLISSTESSLINSCQFIGKAKVKLGKLSSSSEAYFGGIVGTAKKSSRIADSSMSIMNSQVGANGNSTTDPTTEFSITTTQDTISYIGAVAGDLTSVSLYSSNVGGKTYQKDDQKNYQEIKLEIKEDDCNNSQYIGGLAGRSKETAVTGCDAITSISVTGNNTNDNYIAGLIADATCGEDGINSSNTETSISVAGLKTSTLLISAGIANLRTDGATDDIILKECLFTASEITSENPDGNNDLSATTIYMGGAIALVKDAKVDQVMSNVDVIAIGSDICNTMYAGGFVGRVNKEFEATNIVAVGRLIPICGNESATEICLGGLVGSVNDASTTYLTIRNAYTLTSIISDSIIGEALNNTYSDSLVGGKTIENAQVDISDVYHSTDITLTTNDKNYGTNLSAYTLINYNETNLTDADIWKQTENAKSKLPYLVILEDSLKKYEILVPDTTTSKYGYVQGSALRPIETTNAITVKEGYKYYIVTTSTTILGEFGELNGVLIGHDTVIKVKNNMFVSEVNKHSAISNVHLEIEKGQTISNSSVVAGTNNGLIFNSSVQGNELDIARDVGLIAGTNKGMVSYCYSSAEIISTETSATVSGIVYENKGAINSCYFTGYINNSGTAAGIMCRNTDKGFVYNSYMAGVVAGDIETDETSFFSGKFTSDMGLNNYIDTYANVETAEVKSTDGVTEKYHLQTISSAKLMANSTEDAKQLIRGKWYTTAKYDGGGSINTDADSFGKNYGYPVYTFNKQCIDGDSIESTLKSTDLLFSLDTGKGEADSSATLEDRYDSIFSNTGHKNAYKIPHLGVLSAVHALLGKPRNYLIIYPINGKNIEWTAVGTLGVAQDFKRQDPTSESDGESSGVSAAATTGGFNGVIASNKYLLFTSATNTCTIEGLKNNGLFANVNNAYIGNIVLGNFGGTDVDARGNITAKYELNKSGPLGTNVIGTDVYVNSIKYETNSIVYGDNISALFGTIEASANLTIENFSTCANTLAVKLNGTGNIGVLASEITAGSVTLIYGSTTPTSVGNEMYFRSEGGSGITAGGLVGKMSGGKLKGGESIGSENVINVDHSGTVVSQFGGIVGEMSGGTVEHVQVQYNNDTAEIHANKFGSLVAKVGGNETATFENCVIYCQSTKTLEIKGDNIEGAGYIVGEIAEGASISISGLKSENINGITTDDGSTGSAVGGIVGKQAGALTLGYTTDAAFTIDTDLSDVGGIIGEYIKGDICVYKQSTAGSAVALSSGSLITIKGKNNVGGFIGKATGFPTISKNSSSSVEASSTGSSNEYRNFLNCEKFAEITINNQGCENVGGLFGLLCAGNSKITSGSSGASASSGSSTTGDDGVKNSNTIKFEDPDSSKSVPVTVENIGGVAGKIEASESITVYALNNAGSITFKSSYNVKNVGGVAGYVAENVSLGDTGSNAITNISGLTTAEEIKLSITNLGGIVGYFEGVKIVNASNGGAIGGVNGEDPVEGAINSSKYDNVDKLKNAYVQCLNVGGIVGYVNGSTSSIEASNSSGAIKGYQNVGGIVGYATSLTISGGTASSVSAADAGVYIDLRNLASGGTNVEGSIVGVIDVGGLVGAADGLTIVDMGANADIYGNANVGGLIGYATGSTVERGIAGSGATDEKDFKTIKGVYYNYHFKDEDNVDHISFIPTSIGGLIGVSSGTTITNCIVAGITLKTSNEGEEINEGTPDKNTKGMISTISNKMLSVSSGAGSGGLFVPTELENLDKSSSSITYSKMSSGIGGFVGTLDSTSSVDNGTTETTSYMQNLTINAPLGINVGTYYGYCGFSDEPKFPQLSKTEITLEDGTTENNHTINVDGAYNIGAIAGKVTNAITGFSNDALKSYDTANVTISLQENLAGMYVGGLFGEVQSNSVTGLIIKPITDPNKVNIKINSDDSYYIGGLVGKLTVVAGDNQFTGENWYGKPAEAAASSTVPLVDGDDAQNFGGLVGMLKCTGTSGAKYNVGGVHYYAFTVNAIENQAYVEGQSQYDTEIRENNVYLYAQANYINQDTFNISATSKDTFYDENASNPLFPGNGDYVGWAQEYTGFKQMQRCIPQDQNNGADWDSIAVVYNAEFITEVGTVKNMLGPTRDPDKIGLQENAEDHRLFYTKGSNQIFVDENHIIYTVYKKNQDTEILYSAVGIAEVAKVGDTYVTDGSVNTGFYTDSSYTGFNDEVYTLAEYYYVRNQDENYQLFGTYYELDGGCCGEQKQPFFVTGEKVTGTSYDNAKTGKIRSINQIGNANLLWFDWNGNTEYVNNVEVKDPIDRSPVITSEEQVKLFYYQTKSDHYFDFKVIYANSSLKEHASYADINDNDIPSSGSIFKINGLKPTLSEEVSVRKRTWWEKNSWWVYAAIELAVAFLTYGANIGLSAAIKAIGTATKLAKLAVASLKIVKALVVAVHFMSKVAACLSVLKLAEVLTYTDSVTGSKNLYWKTKDQNFGLLTTTTTTNVKYDNGEMVGSLGSVITKVDVDGSEYYFTYCSTTRPSDYYSSYYIVTSAKEADNIWDVLDNGLIKGVSKNDSKITSLTHEGKTLKYKVKYDEIDAEQKYIYYEGAYYCNLDAKAINYYKTQELSDPAVALSSPAQYYYVDGVGYVAGKLDSGKYVFDSVGGNIVTYNSGSYELNGKTLSNAEMWSDVKYRKATAEDAKNGINGYDYVENVYYTTLGSSGGNKRYAKFEYYGGSIDNLTYGIDYVTFSYTLFTNDESGDYYFNGSSYTLIEDASYSGTRYSATPMTANFIIAEASDTTFGISGPNGQQSSILNSGFLEREIYPYSAENPYNTTFSGSAKDNNTYIATQVSPGSGTREEITYDLKVKYFYYEGGYKSYQDLYKNGDEKNVLYNSVYVNVGDPSTIDGAIVLFYEKEEEDGTKVWTSVFIEPYKLKPSEWPDYLNGDYYTTNISEITTLTPAEKTPMMELYLAMNNYKIVDGDLYVRNDNYLLGTDGCVYKLYLEDLNLGNKKAFVHNRYLSYNSENGYKGVYTMFKYSDSLDSKGLWKIETKDSAGNVSSTKYYYLIPTKSGMRRPNLGYYDTYLVESAKVSLGGGYNLHYTNGSYNSSGVKVGDINIKPATSTSGK